MLKMIETTEPPAIKRGSLDYSRTKEWFDAKVKEGARSPITEIVTLTPTLAGIMLENNEGNRRISETLVDGLVRDMVGGRWSTNGESLVVSKDGFLNDGQHRCTAVINANVCVQMVVVFGVSRASRFTVDQGRVRTAGDYIGMNGISDANHVASVCAMIWMWREKNRISTGGADRPTKSEVLLVAEHYKDVPDSILIASQKGCATYGGKTTLAFCHWAIKRKAGVTRSTEFINQMIVGNDLKVGHPILLARNRLSATNSRLKPNEKIELIFRAWNAMITGERPRTLMALNGQLPKILT